MIEASRPNATNALSRHRIVAQLVVFGSRYGTVAVVVLLLLAFGLTSDHFLTSTNLLNILRQISIIAVIGIGMTMVLLIGGIDLSVASVALLSATIAGLLLAQELVPAPVAIAAALAAGAGVGLLNGLIVEKTGISPVIVTLGMLIGIRGLAQVILLLGDNWIWIRDPLFVTLGNGELLGVPMPAVVMLVGYAVASAAMGRTMFGRWIYAIGGNVRAAALSGVPVGRTRVSVYALSGLLAAVGGLLLAARIGIVNPPIGRGMEFAVITAVILGGTSISGGVGRVERTLLGALIVGMVLNYMTIRGISAEWQAAATGFIILAAAVLDRIAQGGGEHDR